MKRIKNFLKDKPRHAIFVPAFLCCITFVTNLFVSLKDGVISNAEYHQLLSMADGFEAAILFIVMIVLRDKKK
jgi:hypothetical protein